MGTVSSPVHVCVIGSGSSLITQWVKSHTSKQHAERGMGEPRGWWRMEGGKVTEDEHKMNSKTTSQKGLDTSSCDCGFTTITMTTTVSKNKQWYSNSNNDSSVELCSENEPSASLFFLKLLNLVHWYFKDCTQTGMQLIIITTYEISTTKSSSHATISE